MKHTDWLKNKLKDDNFAAQYLTQAVQDLEPAVFIAALRRQWVELDVFGGFVSMG